MSCHTKIFTCCISVIFLPFITGSIIPPVYAQNIQSESSRSPGKKIMVKLKNRVSATTLVPLVDAAKPEAEYAGGIPGTGFQVFVAEEGNIESVIGSMRDNPEVEAAFEAPKLKAADIIDPDDAYKGSQWYLDNAKFRGNPEGAWNLFENIPNLSVRTSDVAVAVFDSGVAANHPDLAGKVAHSYDCTGFDNLLNCTEGGNDDYGHGTHVAGLIAASPGNAAGIAGGGWGVKIISFKVLDAEGNGDVVDLLAGFLTLLDYYDAGQVRIVNLSMGGYIDPENTQVLDTLETYMDYLNSEGFLVVAAAGNCGGTDAAGQSACGNTVNPRFYPAYMDSALAVGALDRNNQYALYSGYNNASLGQWVDVSAPGGSCSYTSVDTDCLYSTYPPDTFRYIGGTSQAAPQVSALAALIEAANPGFTNSQIRGIIQNTARSDIASGGTTYGAIDAYRAVLMALNTAVVTPTVTPTGIPVSSTPTPSSLPEDTPTPTSYYSPTPTLTPTPIYIPYPTTGPAVLPRLEPYPYPVAPFCPVTVISGPDECISDAKLEGDANCDGVSDNQDFLIWLDQYGAIPPARPVDGNSNFRCIEGNNRTYFIDLVDFEAWRRGYY